eukprot:5851915-Pleurochrysis_carterae.AAC.1
MSKGRVLKENESKVKESGGLKTSAFAWACAWRMCRRVRVCVRVRLGTRLITFPTESASPTPPLRIPTGIEGAVPTNDETKRNLLNEQSASQGRSETNSEDGENGLRV